MKVTNSLLWTFYETTNVLVFHGYGTRLEQPCISIKSLWKVENSDNKNKTSPSETQKQTKLNKISNQCENYSRLSCCLEFKKKKKDKASNFRRLLTFDAVIDGFFFRKQFIFISENRLFQTISIEWSTHDQKYLLMKFDT